MCCKVLVPACISEEIEVTTHVFLSVGELRCTFLLLHGMQMNTQYDWTDGVVERDKWNMPAQKKRLGVALGQLDLLVSL